MIDLRSTQVTYLKNVRNPKDFKAIPLWKALAAIAGEKLKPSIEDIRTYYLIGDDDTYKAKKTNLPSVCPHGTFEGPKLANEYFKESSNLFSFDIDHLSEDQKAKTRELLESDPRVVYVFASPSGDGIKAAFRVANGSITSDDDYKAIFVIVEKYFAGMGIEIDKSCKDVRRVTFLSHDPNVYANYEAEIFSTDLNSDAPTQEQEDDLYNLPDYQDEEDGYVPISEEDDDGICPDITLENAASFLPTTFDGRQGWLNVGAALHYQFKGCDEALEIFDSWSQTVPGYTGYQDIVTSWKSLGKRKTGKLVTFKSIIAEYNKTHPKEEREVVSDWKAALDAHVAKFNKNAAQVMLGGKHRIMWRQSRKHDYEFSARNELSMLYDNTMIKIGEKEAYGKPQDVFANHLMAWARHPGCRQYRGGVVFKPNQDIPGCYNTWQGFAVEPIQNDEILIPVRYHIEKVVSGGNKELIEYFYDWCAYTFQNPEVPAMSALVLRGKKGSGKGTIGLLLNKIWGVHARHISNPKHLTGNFNSHLADACFIYADEAFYSGDKKHEGVLKALITEPTMIVERKGVDAYTDTNYLKVFMSTNEDYAVPASEDERRYAVYDVSDAYLQNYAYFDPLVDSVKNHEVQAAFLYEMLNRNIDSFRPGNIPESKGLKAQRFGSLCAIDKWLADYLTADYADDEIGECWEPKVSTADLFSRYIAWCDSQRTNSYDRVGQTPFSIHIKGIYKKDQVGKGRLAGFVLGTQEEARIAFETKKKVSITE